MTIFRFILVIATVIAFFTLAYQFGMLLVDRHLKRALRK